MQVKILLLYTIKSILIHRQDEIYFHFLVNNDSKDILQEVFSSWELPGIHYNFYSYIEACTNVLWKSKTLQSTVTNMQEFLKPLLHLVLPDYVERVFVLDSHIVFLADLAELWIMHNGSQLIGLDSVKSACDTGYGHDHTIDSSSQSVSSERDFSNRVGILLLNLKALRALSWHHRWVTKLIMMNLNRTNTSMAHVISSFPDVYFNLGCAWSIHAATSRIVVDGRSVVVFDQTNHHSYFTNKLHQIHKYNGYYLRHKRNTNCYEVEPDMKPTEEDMKVDQCVMLNWEGRVVRRVHPFFLPYFHNSTDPNEITLVGHGTLDRLHLLETISKKWEGPMSIAFNIKDSEVGSILKYIKRSPILVNRTNISYHLMYSISHIYPINPLRILAHKHVKTPYVFVADIDFVPSFGLYQHLKNAVRSLTTMDKKALVVPVFETEDYNLSFPSNKSEAIKLMQSNAIQMFSAFYPEGHMATNYSLWATAREPYKIEYQWGYEPYLVTKTNVTSFDPVFVDRHHNKISHVYELSLEDFQFIVVPDGFMIHKPHPRKGHLNYNSTCYENRFNEWLYLVRTLHGVPI